MVGGTVSEYAEMVRRRLQRLMRVYEIRIWELTAGHGSGYAEFTRLPEVSARYVQRAEQRFLDSPVAKVAGQLNVSLKGLRAGEDHRQTVKKYLERGDQASLASRKRISDAIETLRERTVRAAPHKVYLMFAAREKLEKSKDNEAEVTIVVTFQRSLTGHEMELFGTERPRSVFAPHLTTVFELISKESVAAGLVAEEILKVETGLLFARRDSLRIQYEDLLRSLRAVLVPTHVAWSLPHEVADSARAIRAVADRLPDSLDALVDGFW